MAKGIGGFCGGGGYGFTKKCLKKLIGEDETKFLDDYKKHCDKTQFCDITTADLLKKKGIELVKIEEFIHHKGPILCEFKIKKDICLPLVGPGKALDDMILPGEVTFDTIKIDGGEIPG